MQRIIIQTTVIESKSLDALLLELKGEYQVYNNSYIALSSNVTRDEIVKLRDKYRTDINVLPAGFDPAQVKLVISDMDSTFINIECVDEIADFANKKAEVSAITEAAMRGELDFAQSLQRRVSLLAGLDVGVLQTVYDERLKLNPGAELMLRQLSASNVKFALVSGGFTFFTEKLKQKHHLDFAHANVLDVQDGKLTGKIHGGIVGAERKAEYLKELCAEMGIGLEQAVAIGDGANDLKMMAIAGMGVAYHAKPKVQEMASCSLNYSGLEGLLSLLGIES